MVVFTNTKPTIYRNLYENIGIGACGISGSVTFLCSVQAACGASVCSAEQRQKAVSAHFTSKQILPFAFAEQCCHLHFTLTSFKVNQPITLSDEWLLRLMRTFLPPLTLSSSHSTLSCHPARNTTISQRQDNTTVSQKHDSQPKTRQPARNTTASQKNDDQPETRHPVRNMTVSQKHDIQPDTRQSARNVTVGQKYDGKP